MRSYFLHTGLACLLTLSCTTKPGGDPKQPPKEEPQTQASKTAPASEPATPPTTTSTTDAASTPATQAQEPASMALFYMGYKDQAVPLACYDAATKSILRESACLDIVPQGSTIAFPEGKTAKIVGRAKYECEPSGEEVSSFTIEGLPPDTFDLIGGVWPESAQKNFHILPEPVDDKGASTLPAPERALVTEAMRAQAPKAKETLILKQVVPLDLDGDGKEDKLYSVVIPLTDDSLPGGYAFGALFYANGQSPEKLQMLQSSDLESFIIDGYTDLDGDKKLELWLSIDYYEGASDAIIRIEDGKVELLGAWGCGA